MAETNATDGAIELAEAEGVDLAAVDGTGADGRITKADVEKAAADGAQKAAAGPPENKAAAPRRTTTEAGERRLQAQQKRTLTAEQQKRQKDLAQSGYRVPDAWFFEQEDRQAHDEAIARNMPSTRPDEGK